VTVTAAQLASVSLPATVTKVEDLGPSPVGAVRPPGVPPTATPGTVNLVQGAGYNLSGPADPNQPAGSVTSSIEQSLMSGGQWTAVNVSVTNGGANFAGTGTYTGPTGAYPLPAGWSITPILVAIQHGILTHLPTLAPGTFTPATPTPGVGPAPTPPGAPPILPPTTPPTPTPGQSVTLTPGTSYTMVGPWNLNIPAGSASSSLTMSLTGSGQWQDVVVNLNGDGSFILIGTYTGPAGPSGFPADWTVTPTAQWNAPVATWAQSTADITKGTFVRGTVSLAAYQVANAAAAVGTPGDRERFVAFLWPTSGNLALLGLPFVWGPSDEPPVDWPDTDQNAAGAGFHFQFYYPFSVALSQGDLLQALAGGVFASSLLGPQSALAGSVQIWTAQGPGQAIVTSTSNLTWWPTTSLLNTDHVRADVDPADVATLATALGVTDAGNPCDTLRAIVRQSGFEAIVGLGMGVLVWCGTDLLPPDWPVAASDPNKTTQAIDLHLEFRNETSGAIQVGSLPIPMTAWVAHGQGA